MKWVYLPKEQIVRPPWIKGTRPWVVVAKLVMEDEGTKK